MSMLIRFVCGNRSKFTSIHNPNEQYIISSGFFCDSFRSLVVLFAFVRVSTGFQTWNTV